MINYGKDLWTMCGGVLVANTATLPAVIKKAGLDWRVVKESLTCSVAGHRVPVPGKSVLVRTDTMQALGIVKKNYRVIQNAEAFSYATKWVTQGDAEFHAAGQFNDVAWIILEMKRKPSDVSSGDSVLPCVLLVNSFGSRPMAVYLLPTRKGSKVTLGVIELVHLAHQPTTLPMEITPQLVWDTYDRMISIYRRMTGRVLTQQQFAQFLQNAVYNTRRSTQLPTGNRIRCMRERIVSQLESVQNNRPGVRGTAWAAFNAVTEYVEWCQTCPKEEEGPWRRLAFVWFGQGAALRDRAFNELATMVG